MCVRVSEHAVERGVTLSFKPAQQGSVDAPVNAESNIARGKFNRQKVNPIPSPKVYAGMPRKEMPDEMPEMRETAMNIPDMDWPATK